MRPKWLRVRGGRTAAAKRLAAVVAARGLNTVCQQAACPNVFECFSRLQVTFLIMGTVCTRSCRYCRVDRGRPTNIDNGEPEAVAQVVSALSLSRVVVTSVTRDDQADGGAGQFARTVGLIRGSAPEREIELLVPDFAGSGRALQKVIASRPDWIGHNIETVAALFNRVRPQADYRRSLSLLRQLSLSGLPTRSGLMVGLGESRSQIERTLSDLVGAGVRSLTIGQYLPPSPSYLPLVRYYRPAEFRDLAAMAKSLGFREVLSGPLVRSSLRPGSGARRQRVDLQPILGNLPDLFG